MKTFKNGNSFWIISIFFCMSIFFQSYFVDRGNFLSLLFFFIIDFLAYYFIIQTENIDSKKILRLTIVLHLIPMFALPSLSNDFYRFLWDGELLNQGINPYDFKPNELIWKQGFINSTYYEELYAGMGNLSQENYSCYPVVNQFYFYLATFFSENIFLNTVILRLLILATLFFGFIYLEKLLILTKIESSKKYLFFLNPLLIIEVSQNLHFEGVMLSFFIMGIYFISQINIFKAIGLGSFFLMLSIQIKLIPLMLLPFILRFSGWKKAIFIWGLTLFFTIFISIILIHPTNYLNFLKSISLYFRQFEFNSFILYWYIQYGEWKYGYNRIQTFGPYLSRIAIEFVIIFAWLGNNFSLKKMFTRMFFAMIVYYFLSSTVHPWYLLTPLLLSVFTSYKFILVWSFLVLLSYISYTTIDSSSLRFIFLLEYLIVFGCFVYEIIMKYHFFDKNLKKI